MNNHMKRTLLFVLCSYFALALAAKTVTPAASLPTYYKDINGKSGKSLFDAVHVVAKEGYSSYEWFIDGELQGGNQSFILNTNNMTGGIYTVMLIVTTESGDMYSAEWQVTITKIGEN